MTTETLSELYGSDVEVLRVNGTAQLRDEPEFTQRFAHADAPKLPRLVIDIGGGSTEFVLGDATGLRAARSVDIGCVRLTERRLHGDPPSADEVQATVADIRAALGLVTEEVPVAEAASLAGLAGSVTTVAALALDLPAYDPEAIHGSRIPVSAVRAVTAGLLTATRARRAAASRLRRPKPTLPATVRCGNSA